MAKPVYNLPLAGRTATKHSHDAEINRCIDDVWAAAVVAQLDGEDAADLVEEIGTLQASIHADAEQVAEDADFVRSVVWPPLVVLALGQSNMRSVGALTGGDLTVNPNVLAWNSQAAPMANGSAWQVATPGSNPFIGSADANNLAFQFCKELQRRTGRQVYLILAALGSHHIEAFMNAADLTSNGWTQTPGEADLFTFAMTQMAAALPLVPGAPTSVDYLIWHQGEANKEEQAELYARKLRTVLKRFENNGRIVRNRTDVIAGELLVGANNGRFRDRHASALRRLQVGTREDAFPRFKIASSEGLQPTTLLDDLHVSGSDLDAFGRRYVDAAFMGQPLEVLDPTECDLSADGHLGWATNIGAAQAHTTYARREPVYLSSNTVTIEDSPTLGWCHVAPANAVTQLAGRKMFRIDPYAQFLITMRVHNPHPSATGNYGVAVLEYDEDKSYMGVNLMTAQTIAPGATANHLVRFGHADNGRSNHRSFSANARWFAPLIRFNPGGAGAAVRFVLPNMRWI